jgi:hypothetical protein
MIADPKRLQVNVAIPNGDAVMSSRCFRAKTRETSSIESIKRPLRPHRDHRRAIERHNTVDHFDSLLAEHFWREDAYHWPATPLTLCRHLGVGDQIATCATP